MNTDKTLSAPTGNWQSMLREATGLLGLPMLALSAASLRDEPAGDGSTVVVLPGFGGDDLSTWPLRAFLRSLGYRVRGWGLGSNRATVPESIDVIGTLVERHLEESDAPLSLVGWSLGGYIAREVARDKPHGVRRVITLGSPVIGGPKYTSVAVLAPLQGWNLDEIEVEVERRKGVPLRVPTTAIFSRRDGIVAWRACIDPEGDAPVEHVEVNSSHIGLGFDAHVYRLVARRLARRDRNDP
ncbi:MAG: alpha/beta fold hydrolase [Pseudomonadales bacterium]